MTEEQIHSMRYYQWLVHGDRYGLRCDLFFYLANHGHQGFPRYILFRNGYDRGEPDAIPITVADHPVVLSQKQCHISDDDFHQLCLWIAAHQTDINYLMDRVISLRQFLDQTSTGPMVDVEIEEELLFPMQGIKTMRMLEPDYLFYLMEFFNSFWKGHPGFNVDVFVADQDICEFGEGPLVVLVGNGYGSIVDYHWDFIAVTVAEHPVVVSTTEIKIRKEDLDEVCSWVAQNRYIIKWMSMNSYPFAVSQSIKKWWLEKKMKNTHLPI